MPLLRSLLPAALAAGIVAMTGCSNKDTAADQPVFTGTPFVVSEFAPDMRDHHTSWGHSGRGGAALRKPAYQPVLGSPDVLESRYGKVHPELQYQAKAVDTSISIPPALVAGTCAEAKDQEQAAVQVMTPQQAAESHSVYTLANSRGTVSDYIQVRNKLCKGAERLTYEEWEILVMGTPKDVPLRLQPNQIKSVK
ncbi:hypothetical protein Q1Z72_00845 [Pseudomonas qingdaonensis]|jgi:hypothetical protein|uniref:hypothetical protein n=1 Tax=Pseudomonas qingdaonensis TaxID=2056231 RepID=UPI00265D6941|nr:hypothetical protein [Pseudomonas qingdaonensis]WKL67256.1 hypothetical protein Q1Z72_00845 [Pseudomonas qingdaonensis]